MAVTTRRVRAGGGAQVLLELGEGQLDRVEVGRVGRQEEQPAPAASTAAGASSPLWALRLSSITTWPGRSVGTRTPRR